MLRIVYQHVHQPLIRFLKHRFRKRFESNTSTTLLTTSLNSLPPRFHRLSISSEEIEAILSGGATTLKATPYIPQR
ncbi:hypothetical protein PCANB_002308 [Pneumocystis canis]|nr:hypothetical protein PCANB_002308 [Pneumocystis canis]